MLSDFAQGEHISTPPPTTLSYMIILTLNFPMYCITRACTAPATCTSECSNSNYSHQHKNRQIWRSRHHSEMYVSLQIWVGFDRLFFYSSILQFSNLLPILLIESSIILLYHLLFSIWLEKY